MDMSGHKFTLGVHGTMQMQQALGTV